VALPINEVELERWLSNAIKTLLETVSSVGQVHVTERYASNEEEDEALFTTPDPVLGDKMPLTNVIEIGIPAIGEDEYTSDTNTKLTLTYPVTYNLGVVDSWNKPDFEFHSSAEMFIGTYMRARRKFKESRDLGLGSNVTHYFLQQHSVTTIQNEKGEAVEHEAEWSLTVTISGIKF
jgi:hypothetical protein